MPDTYARRVRAQTAKIQALFGEAATAPRGTREPLLDAREFARELIVCPTEDAARRLLQRHPGNTRAFVELAIALAGDLPPAVAASDPQSDGATTPFYHLCEMVLDALAAMDDLGIE